MAQEITNAEFRANANDVFKIGDTLWVDVTYDGALGTLVGSPSLKIQIGAASSTRTAACALQVNGTTLQCGYTVAEGDEGSAGGTLVILNDLVGGGLLDTNLAGHIQAPPTGVEVDGIRIGVAALTVQGPALASPRTAYKTGDTITLRVTFDEPTTSAGVGSFGVTLVLDGEDRAMTRTNVVTPSSANTYAEFAYVVAAADNASRIRVAYTNTTSLKDDAGNAGLKAAPPTLASAAGAAKTAIDNRAPTMLSVRGPDSVETVHSTGAEVPLTVQFSEEVIVTGDPILGVTVGSDTGPATCPNPGTNAVREMTCNLVISADWSAPSGISIPRNPIRLVSATIKDPNDHALDLAFSGTRLPNQKVDAIAPWIKSVTLTVPSNANLKLNSLVEIDVTFSEEVKLASGAAPPVPSFDIGIGDATPVPVASSKYVGGTATKWQYRYALMRAHLTSGAKMTFSIDDPGTTHLLSTAIEDIAGNDLDTRIDTKLPISVQRTVPATITDTSKPTVQGVRVSSVTGGNGALDRKVLKGGEQIKFAVLFSEPVRDLAGIELGIRVGSNNRRAGTPTTASGGFEWTFEYTVQTGDGGAIGVGDLEFGESGRLMDIAAGGNGYLRVARPADPNRVNAGVQYGTNNLSVGSVSGYSVDNTPPRVVKAELLRSPPPGAVSKVDGNRYYGKGDFIRAVLTTSERVTVDGRAELKTVKLLTNVRSGGCATMDLKLIGSDGKRLTFECQVVDEQQPFGLGLNGLQDSGTDLLDAAGTKLLEVNGTGEALLARQSTHLIDGTLRGEQEGVLPIVDGSTEPAQTVSPLGSAIVRSSTPTGGYYKAGDTITIEVPLSPTVTFTSGPQLLLNFDEGGSQRLTPAESISSSGTPRTRLTFSYRVQSGDEDVDGFTASLSGGGTLSVEDGRRVSLGSVGVSGIRVDARAPELESLRITSSAGSDGTYKAGDDIVVRATFSEDVERQGTADPSVPIRVGDQTRTATLQSPSSTSGGDTWVFSYKVVAGDNDADGVSIAEDALDGELEDAAGNEASITHSAVSASTSHRVDTKAPSIVSLPVITGDDDNLFLEGDTITVAVPFDEDVHVTTRGSGAVKLRFFVGGSEREAGYVSGDGSETLTFAYEVVAGDSGRISLPRNALDGEVEDAAGNAAEGTTALATPYFADASAPMLVGTPFITSSPPNGDTYVTGDAITVQVGFDEPVVVEGTPRVYLTVGPRRRFASFVGAGTSDADLRFSYTVRPGDMDDDGVSIAANELKLTSGATIEDENGLSVASSRGTVAHPAVPDQNGHKVDAVAPGIESVAITSTPASGDAYLIDETIEVTVTFSEDVATEGTPTLGLVVDSGRRAAACAKVGARTDLVCSYTVAANDFDANGVSVNKNALEGEITDLPGNAATLTHDALADDPEHKVYAAAPEAVRTIDTLTLAAGGGTNSLNLAGIFTGFQLTYTAESSDTSVATASVSGTELTVLSGMEGTARVTVTATNLAGSASTSFGVVVATDPVEKAVLNDALAAIGRSMLSSTASVIGSRFELAATGSQMALGGSRFGGSLSPQMQRFLAGNDPFALEERMGGRALFSGSGSEQAYGGGYGLTSDRLFTGTSFNLPLNAMGTGDAQFAVWGAGDLQGFEGEPDAGMYDGSSSSGHIGVDARGDGWLAGVSVSRSGAEADYDFDGTAQATGVRGGGTLETSVTAFHPYARLELGADSEIWVIGGFGGGEAELSRTHVSGSRSSDLSMAMAVGGLRRALAMELGGAALSLRGDAGFLGLETDGGTMAVDGLSASVSRLRLGLEAAWDVETVTPFVEVSGRFDGGDGQTGGGLELAGGLRILNPESGFGLEAKGRILAMHTGDGYSESGIGVTASFEPGAAGRGITFRLSPRWGGSADSTDLFWDEVGNVRDASQYAYGLDRAQTWGVDAALGYGIGLRSMPGVVTPFGQMDVTGDRDQRIRVGVRYGLMQGLLGGTQVELSAERVDGEMHRVGETRVLVSGRARF